MHLSREAIDEMEHLYKINFMNSIFGYKSANLIARKSEDGISNVAINGLDIYIISGNLKRLSYQRPK